MIYSQRRLSTIIDNVINNLSINYRKEFEQLKANDNSIERIEYLKMVLKSIKQRDNILHDIDETIKLSNGKGGRRTPILIDS
jgi:hypothetical protein